MTERKLHEFWITLSFQAEAFDHEQATEIAIALLAAARKNELLWKVNGGEIVDIEKAS